MAGTSIAELSININATTAAAEDSLAHIDETAAKTGETMQASADEVDAAYIKTGDAAEESADKAEVAGDEAAAAMKKPGEAAEESGSGLQKFLGDMLGVGAGIGAIQLASQAFDFLKDQLTETVDVGMEANETQAQTVAVLKSSHDAAGVTATAVDDLAEHYMDLTGISADTIQQSENMLLTFRGIGKDVFPQATQAALDMATALHMGPTQAALQLGKALDDPATGLTRLTREGVVFTAEQTAQIKAMTAAGNTAGAQKLMLAELNKEFGGSAEAAGQANGGIKILQAQMEETREKIGQALIPVLDQLAHAFEPIVTWAGSMVPKAVAFLTDHAGQVKIVLLALATAAIPALMGALAGLVPILWAAISPIIAGILPVLAIGAAIAGLALWFKHLYDTSKPFKDAITVLVTSFKILGEQIAANLQPILEKLGPVLQQIGSFIGGVLNDAMNSLVPQIISAANTVSQFAVELSQRLGPALHNIFDFIQAALPVLKGIWDAIWPTLAVVLQDVWGIIQGIITVAWNLISGIFKVALDLIGGNWSQAWTDIQTTLSGVWDGIKEILGNALNAIWTLLQATVGKLLGLIGNLVTGIITWIQSLPNKAITFFIQLATGIEDQIKTLELKALALALSLVNGILNYFETLPGKAMTTFRTLGSDIIATIGGFEDKMIEAGKQLLDGLLKGIENEVGNVIKAAENAAQSILSGIKGALGISSPSKEGATLGQYLMQGLAAGITGNASLASDAAKKAAGGALSALGSGVSGAALYGAGGAALAGGGGASLQNGQIVVELTNVTNMDGQKVAQVVSKYQPNVIRTATGSRGF